MLAHRPPSRPWLTGRLACGSVVPGAPGPAGPGGVASFQAVSAPRAPSPVAWRYPVYLAPPGSGARPRTSVPLAARSSAQSVPVAASPGGLGPLLRQLLRCPCPVRPARLRPAPREDRVGAPPYAEPSARRLLSGLPSCAPVPARRCAPPQVAPTATAWVVGHRH